MFKVICVTNRKLCENDFLLQVEKVAKAKPYAIMLREKDLNEDEYYQLAVTVKEICDKNDVIFIAHNFLKSAKKLGCKAVHFPLYKLNELSFEDKSCFKMIGASCHSLSDAVLAEKLGCTYISVGNIFETECKKGLKGNGVELISHISHSVKISVFGIGGISVNNVSEVIKSGADGCCTMSGFMKTSDANEYIKGLKGGDLD